MWQSSGIKWYTQIEMLWQIGQILSLKTKEKNNMCTGRFGNTSGQKCNAKGSRKENKFRRFTYRCTTNVEHEIYDRTGNKWSHRNSNKSLKERFGSHTGKTFKRFTTDGCARNMTHNTESTAVWNLKSERGFAVVCERNTMEKRPVTRDNSNNNNNNKNNNNNNNELCVQCSAVNRWTPS